MIIPVRLRTVFCMVCLWHWQTGAASCRAAQCPRCKQWAGVSQFVVVRPLTEGN